MNKYARLAFIGLLAGLAACYALVATQETSTAGLMLGVLAGVAHAFAFRSTPRAYADNAMTAAALAVPAWIFFGESYFPRSRANRRSGPTQGMRDLFPELIGWVYLAVRWD